MTKESKPVIAYVHRYPPEHEAVQFFSLRGFLDLLLEKFNVVYISMRGVKPIDADLRRGLRLIEVPLTVNPTSGLSKYVKTVLYYACFIPCVLRPLRRLQPDFIICKEPLPFIPWLVSWLNIPFMVASISDFWLSIFLGGSRLGRWLSAMLDHFEIKRWARSGAVVVANTRAEAAFIASRGMKPANIFTVRASYPSGLFFPCDASAERRQLQFSDEDWVVATHGTIRPGKGYRQLLKWWQLIIRKHPRWHMLIIGGAGGENWCRRTIRRLGLKANTHMTGWLPTHLEVNRYLNAADCLLAVRRNSEDNMCLITSALIHNLATGKPTVATGLPGIAEIIRHGVDGYLFQPDDFESFQATLEYVADHPAEAQSVGRQGMIRERECFDPKDADAETVRIIEQHLRPRP